MLITQLVQSHGDRMTETDRRIVAAMRSRPQDAAFARAAELTAPLGLHESAATRLAQRLGFHGYPQLRDALREDYLAGDGPSQRVRGRIERTGGDDILRAFLDDEVDALRAVSLHVEQAALDDAAARILDAGRVHLFGQGNASILVDQLARRLTRFGLGTSQLTGSRRDIAERAALIAPCDVVLAFAFRRTPSALPTLLEVARETRAASVLVTDTLLTLSPSPDVTIAAPRGDRGEFLTLTVPMAIANALVLTIAKRAPEPTTRSLDRVEHLLERLDT